MGVQFNADEIFEMAEQMERNGARFYRKAADRASNVRDRELLLKLAAMEDDHEKTFAAMRADLSQRERWEVVDDPYGEAALYLRAFADGHVFDVKVDPSEMLTGQETMEEVLDIAIGLEKDSIVFYLGIRDMVPQDLGRDRVDDIIKEERGHVVLLSQELAALSE